MAWRGITACKTIAHQRELQVVFPAGVSGGARLPYVSSRLSRGRGFAPGVRLLGQNVRRLVRRSLGCPDLDSDSGLRSRSRVYGVPRIQCVELHRFPSGPTSCTTENSIRSTTPRQLLGPGYCRLDNQNLVAHPVRKRRSLAPPRPALAGRISLE